jgi:hypothetical protein
VYPIIVVSSGGLKSVANLVLFDVNRQKVVPLDVKGGVVVGSSNLVIAI